MFKRLQYENWEPTITLIAFFLCFLTFIYFSIKAIRMKKSDREHMSNLPLEEEKKSTKPKDHD